MLNFMYSQKRIIGGLTGWNREWESVSDIAYGGQAYFANPCDENTRVFYKKIAPIVGPTTGAIYARLDHLRKKLRKGCFAEVSTEIASTAVIAENALHFPLWPRCSSNAHASMAFSSLFAHNPNPHPKGVWTDLGDAPVYPKKREIKIGG